MILFNKLVLTTYLQPGGAPFCSRVTTVITRQTGLGLWSGDVVRHAKSVVIVMPWNLRRFTKPATASLPWSVQHKGYQRWFTVKATRALVIGLVRRAPREVEPCGPRSFWTGDRAGRVKRMERAMELQADERAPHLEVGNRYDPQRRQGESESVDSLDALAAPVKFSYVNQWPSKGAS